MSGLTYGISNLVRELATQMSAPFTFLTSVEASSSSTVQEVFKQLNIANGPLDRGLYLRFSDEFDNKLSAILISAGQYETIQKVIGFVPSVMGKLTTMFDTIFEIKTASINSLNHTGYSLSQAAIYTTLGTILTVIGACQINSRTFANTPSTEANKGTNKGNSRFNINNVTPIGLTIVGVALLAASVIKNYSASLTCLNIATTLQRL